MFLFSSCINDPVKIRRIGFNIIKQRLNKLFSLFDALQDAPVDFQQKTQA
jgi:Ca2+-binding EF-hand superfamily protein